MFPVRHVQFIAPPRPFIPPYDLNQILMIAHPRPADLLPLRRSLHSSARRLHRGRRSHHPVDAPPALPAESGGGLDLLSQGNTHPRKQGEISAKEIRNEKVCKRREFEHSSRSLAAELMGLATLPSPRMQNKLNRSQTTSSQASVCSDDCSCRRRDSEDQEIQDVFELPETSKKKDHTACGDATRMLNCSENKSSKECTRQKSHTSTLQKSKEFVADAFEVPDSRKDLSPEFLQDSIAVFTKPLQDLNCAPSSPHQSKITTLRPSEGTKHWKDEVWCKSSKIERNPGKCFSLEQNSAGKNSVSLPLNSPARIVILQPSHTEKRAEANYFIHENLFFCPTRYMNVAASGVQELNNHGRHKHKLSQRMNAWSSKVFSSRDTARGMTKKMRQAISNNTKKNFTSYTGITNSSLKGNQKLSHKSSNCSISTSSCSVEYSVSKEARNRLFKTWKISHRLQRLTHLGSSRLGEILAQADKETKKDRTNISSIKSVSDRKLASKKEPTTKGHPWSKDGNVTLLQSTKSIPAFLSVELSERKQDGSKCKRNPIRCIHEKEPSVSEDAKFWKPGIMLVESSTHHARNSQRTHSFVDETMLNVPGTHVNSEELRKNIHLKHFLEEGTFHPAPTDCAVGQKSQYISSDHSQEEQLPCESREAGSRHQSSNVLEKSTPVSLLETPSEDITFSFECLERLSLNLKEFQIQLQLLKLEPVVINTEEKDACVLRDADYAGAVGDSDVLLASGEVQKFTDDDDRDFFYLLDMVIESGTNGLNENKLSDTSYLLDYPVDQNVFDKLEKKYERDISWSRSERKLLFDQLNCILEDIVITCMDVHPRISPKINQPAWDFEDLIEYTWQVVVKQRMELDCNQENKLLEPGWFDLEFAINSIGEKMERMLTDELLQEVIRDLLS